MTAPTVGEPVYVLWDVGNPYGHAGEVLQVAYDNRVQSLVDAGYGKIVSDPGDGNMQPFGHQPRWNPITLSKGAEFTQDIKAPAGSGFPAGTTARIDIINPATRGEPFATWQGTVTTDEVSFSVPPEQTDPVPHRYKYRLYVTLPTTPARPVLWYYGPIERKE